MRTRNIYHYILIIFLIIIISINNIFQIIFYSKFINRDTKISYRSNFLPNEYELSTSQSQIIKASNPIEDAQLIRDNAGVPKNETVGVEKGKKPGVNGSLDDSDRIVILTYSDAESKSSSGSGTKENPFIIKDKRLDNSETSQDPAGIYILDPDADYYIHIDNCEIFGYKNEQIYVNIGTEVIISNCTIYSNDYGVHQEGGDLKIFEAHFSGLGSGGILASSEKNNSLIVRNSQFNSDLDQWGVNSKGIYSNGTGVINITYTSVYDADSLDFVYIFKDTKLIFSNCYLINVSRALYRSNMAIGFISQGSIIKYLEISNTKSTSINLLGESNLEISYCTISNSAPDERLILISISDENLPENISVHHCKFTDSVGYGGPGDECLEAFFGKNIEFHHNWVTECTEDAFELAYPRTGCLIYSNVGDNVERQIVDIYQAYGNESDMVSHGGFAGVYIHHIYGNSFSDCAVRITDADGIVVHDIYSSSGALFSVILEQRHGIAGKTPTDCIIIDPIINYLPNSSKLGIDGLVGPGNVFINISSEINDIDIINNTIYLNGKSFELSTKNSYISNITILKFLEEWNTREESVMEWVELGYKVKNFNYSIYTGLNSSEFQLEKFCNNYWRIIQQVEVNEDGFIEISIHEPSNCKLRLILINSPVYFFNIELFSTVLIFFLIILFFIKIKRQKWMIVKS